MSPNTRSHTDYSVGWVCALPQEQTAAIAMLDERHESLSKPATDTNAYTLGSIGQHNIVIACLPKGHAGPNSAATVATQMVQTFPSIKVGLLVGIGGGIPPKVRLGDVVVSTPDGQFPGVVQWDLGQSTEGGKFERTGSLNNPPSSLLSALSTLESKHELEGSKIPDYLEQFRQKYPLAAKTYLDSISLEDLLFKSNYRHVHGKPIEDIGADDTEDDESASNENEEGGCVSCDPSQIIQRENRPMCIHYGLIASSNATLDDAKLRNKLNKALDKKVLCVETEAAGLMNNFPCIVIRGICDYVDSHRNKTWRKYAAAVAAAFAKELLGCAQSSDVEGERPIRDILNDVIYELNQMNRDIKAGFGNTRKGLNNLIEVQKSQEQNKALAWLSSIDSASMHHDYIKKCEPGTGQNLVNSQELHQWINIPQTTLFCSGIPGAGKTSQTAILIDHLIDKFQQDKTIGLAFFYYRFDRQETQQPEQLISNLIKQLGQNHEPSREKIQGFYERHKKKGRRPLIKELVDLLEGITSLLSRAYVIIDALDECGDNDYSRTRLLDSLFAAQKKGLNICATSRNIHIIEQKFEGAVKWQVIPSENDIFSFLDRRIAQLPDFVLSNIPLQEEIKGCIESAIDGMFLLAQLYIDSLVGKRSVASVRRTLSGLRAFSGRTQNRSDILSTAYHKAMERIQQQKGDLPTDAMTVLAWVVKSRKPLRLDTLRVILAIDTETSKLDKDNFPSPDHIVQACAPLVVIESETQTARLAHYTIQEYFERSNSIWMEKSQILIANTCMSYLSFSRIHNFFMDERLISNNIYDILRNPSYPYMSPMAYLDGYSMATFYKYATEFWAYHVKEALVQGLEVPKVVHFLEHKNGTKPDLWHDSLMQIDLARTSLFAMAEDDLLEISEQSVGLHVAACSGLSDVVAKLISMGYNPDVRDNRHRSPLWWAAYNGHPDIVKLLLEQNVDTEAKDTFFYRTPLQLAANRGLVSIVRLLLNKGADLEPGNRDEIRRLIIRPKDNGLALAFKSAFKSVGHQSCSIDTFRDNVRGLSPLISAIENGHEEISALLLKKGAKIENKSDGEPAMSALHVAIKADRHNMVELLLAHKADIEIRDLHGSAALQIAAIDGQPSITESLLLHGADVKSQDKEGLTALHHAAKRDQTSIIRLLLLNGADIRTRDKNGCTALHTAAKSGSSNTIKILLSNGADVESQDKEGLTALHHALKRDQTSIIHLLLSNGANIRTRDKYGCTALHMAVKTKRSDTVRVLLAYGVDIDVLNGERWTALHIAAYLNQAIVAGLLLKYGADTNIQTNKGRTALHIAASCKSPETVETLLAHKAEIEVRDREGWTALHIAAKLSGVGMVKLLLAHGANKKLRNNQGCTALHIATGYNTSNVVEALITHKADMEIQTNEGWTALHIATRFNKLPIIKLLLTHEGDINAQNQHGETPLMIASRYGLKEMVDLLIAQGARHSDQSALSCSIISRLWPTVELLIAKGVTIDEGAVAGGGRMLHIAIDKNDSLVVDWLLKNNANVNFYDVEARCKPLHRAVERGNVAIVSRLLDVDGIDTEAKAAGGFSPLTMALRNRNKEIAKLLMNSGKVCTAFGRPEFLDFLKKNYR